MWPALAGGLVIVCCRFAARQRLQTPQAGQLVSTGVGSRAGLQVDVGQRQAAPVVGDGGQASHRLATGAFLQLQAGAVRVRCPGFAPLGQRQQHRVQGAASRAPAKQEIARMIGASREMVSRVIKDLQEKNLIRTDKRKIIVLDRQSMAHRGSA